MIRLGLAKEEAVGYALGRRYWFLAQMHITRFTMNNEYWEEMGYKGLEWNLNRRSL